MEDNWITLDEYCKRTGDTRVAVRRRLEEGAWRRGTHVASPEGEKDLCVHLPTAQAWHAARAAPAEAAAEYN